MTVKASNMDQPKKISHTMDTINSVSEGLGTKCHGPAVTAREYDPRVIGDGKNWQKLYGGDKPLGYENLMMHTEDCCDPIKSTVDGNVPVRSSDAAPIP